MAGPAVLKRSNLANDDDLETCEESTKIHPFDYFAFEESGKTWCFAFPTLWRWCMRKQVPTNPYTKVPLTADTRKRIRAIWSYNRRHRIAVPVESNDIPERIRGRWNIVSQVLEDNGFGALPESAFVHLTKRQYVSIFQMIEQDLEFTIPNKRMRTFAHRIILQGNGLAASSHAVQYMLHSSFLFMFLLVSPKDPYNLAFTFLSAMYRC
jgi:hypothetical protein